MKDFGPPGHQEGALRLGLTAWRARLFWMRGFLRFVSHRYVSDRCQAVAANLTLTTLLALVPLMTVIFSTFRLLPAIRGTRRTVQDFIFEHFIPAASGGAKTYLLEFVNRASQMNLVGIIVLVLTALLLMSTIDRAFNAIWGTPVSRRFGRKLLLYWALLTLGPLLLGASIGVSSFLFSLPYIKEAGEFRASLIYVLPFLLTTLGLMVLYSWMPNRHVRALHAFIAALIAAVLFEGAKRIFGAVFAAFPTYQAVYGAMAALPVLVVWIYVSWSLVLIGAQICHALGVYRPRRGGVRDPFLLAMRMLEQVWQAQQLQQSLTAAQLLADSGAENAVDVLSVLERAGLLGRVREQELCIARDVDVFNLHALYQLLPWRLPPAALAAHELGENHPLVIRLRATEAALQQSLQDSLRSGFRA